MSILLTEIYDVTLKKDLRDAAKAGFIRPTIGESFMTHRDFKEIVASYDLYSKSVTQFATSVTAPTKIVALSPTKICIFYISAAGDSVIVGSIAENNVVTFGTPVVFATSSMEQSILAVNDTKIVICYRYNVSPFYGKIKVGTINGNNISFGDEQSYTSYSVNFPVLVKLDDTQFCLVHPGINIKIGNISGNTINFTGSGAGANSDSRYFSVVLLSPNKLFISFREQSGGAFKSVVATISGNTVTFGAVSTFLSSSPTADYNFPPIVTKMIGSNKVLIIYTAYWENKPNWLIANVDGTNITFSSTTQLFDYPIYGFNEMGMIDDDKIGIIFRTYNDSTYAINGVIGEIVENNITFGAVSTLNNIDRPYYTNTAVLSNGKFCTSAQFLTGSVVKTIVSTLIP